MFSFKANIHGVKSSCQHHDVMQYATRMPLAIGQTPSWYKGGIATIHNRDMLVKH